MCYTKCIDKKYISCLYKFPQNATVPTANVGVREHQVSTNTFFHRCFYTQKKYLPYSIILSFVAN